MSEYNIQMNKYNALNAGYDQLYPQPMKHANTHAKDGNDPITPSMIGTYNKTEIDTTLQNKADLGEDGKVPESQLPDMDYASSIHAIQHASGGSDPITPESIGAAPAYTYGTEDLTAGTSPLETGKLYFVYE